MKPIPRRIILKGMGIQFLLPLLENFAPLTALGENAKLPTKRKKFIGVYFPNGTYIQDNINNKNGNWYWNQSDGVLYPLKSGSDAIHQQVMILRNLFNGQSSRDPHWQNCAGFLSGNLIRLDLNSPRCGKTIDQYMADNQTTPFRSLEVGGPYYHEHLLSDHPNYPHLYMNRIAWRTDELALTPHTDPYEFFDYLFKNQSNGTQTIKYLQQRNKSILDLVHSQITSIAAQTNAEGRQALEIYATSIREMENSLMTQQNNCVSPEKPKLNYTNRNYNYIDRVQQLQKMLVFALSCGLTQIETIMYAPAVSGDIDYRGDLGVGKEHHGCAHHNSDATSISRLLEMNRMHVQLLKHLLNLLKTYNLLDETLVLFGTDMNDGNLHTTENIPTLLCGGGSDLKLGEDINLPRTSYTQLLLSLLELMGIQKDSLGEEETFTTKNINQLLLL